jgi:diphthine synthase
MIATTHMDLRIRAERSGVKTKVIHNSSILCALSGEIGLHSYNFGKIVTLINGGSTIQITMYKTVYENLVHGLHSIILLGNDPLFNSDFTLNIILNKLLEAEKVFKRNLFNKETFIIIASRIGKDNQSIKAGPIGNLINMDFGDPPHSIVVTGRLHFTESEAIHTLLKLDGEITNNYSNIYKFPELMINNYIQKTIKALLNMRMLKESVNLKDLLENAECYLSDSQRFLNQGEPELAILSIGYAEGLLDSIKFIKNIEIKWD